MQIVQHAANHPNYMRYIQRVPEIDTNDELSALSSGVLCSKYNGLNH